MRWTERLRVVVPGGSIKLSWRIARNEHHQRRSEQSRIEKGSRRMLLYIIYWSNASERQRANKKWQVTMELSKGKGCSVFILENASRRHCKCDFAHFPPMRTPIKLARFYEIGFCAKHHGHEKLKDYLELWAMSKRACLYKEFVIRESLADILTRTKLLHDKGLKIVCNTCAISFQCRKRCQRNAKNDFLWNPWRGGNTHVYRYIC